MSNEKFKPAYAANESLSPKLVWNNYKIKLKFKGSCLKQEDEAAFTPENVVMFFIACELYSWPRDFTLGGCLFGGVKLTKNTDPDKYSCSGFCIGFDTRGKYSLPDDSVGKYVYIFRVDISSSVHIDNKGKAILILGKGPTQGLNQTLAAETPYSISFTRPGINFFFKPAL